MHRISLLQESHFICHISFKVFISSQAKKRIDEDEKGKESSFNLRLLHKHREENPSRITMHITRLVKADIPFFSFPCTGKEQGASFPCLTPVLVINYRVWGVRGQGGRSIPRFKMDNKIQFNSSRGCHPLFHNVTYSGKGSQLLASQTRCHFSNWLSFFSKLEGIHQANNIQINIIKNIIKIVIEPAKKNQI